MLVLRSDAVLARVDPAHGAEVVDLVDLHSGRQLLGRPPFGSEPPRAGDLDEETWTASWRGGWQGCFPNAGGACQVDGVRHGFHGRASNDPWVLIDTDERSCRLRWEGKGLAVERRVAAADSLSVATEVTAVKDDVPIVALEHLTLGLELIEPSVELELPGGRASELDEALGPIEPPADAPAWPEVGLGRGGADRGERWSLADERGLVYVVRDMPEGRATVANPTRGQGVGVTWTAEALPHVIVWHEARASGGVWRNATEVLCIEPCSVPHLVGLEAALAAGQARRLSRGDTMSWTMAVRAL